MHLPVAGMFSACASTSLIEAVAWRILAVRDTTMVSLLLADLLCRNWNSLVCKDKKRYSLRLYKTACRLNPWMSENDPWQNKV